MNRNKAKNPNLISRFSSSLLGRGKKQEGHKLLFNLLLFLKINTERELLNFKTQQKNLKLSIFAENASTKVEAQSKAFCLPSPKVMATTGGDASLLRNDRLLLHNNASSSPKVMSDDRSVLCTDASNSSTRFIYFLGSMGFQEKAVQTIFQKNEKVFQDVVKGHNQSSLSRKQPVVNPQLSLKEDKSVFQPENLKKALLKPLSPESSKESKNITKQHTFLEESGFYNHSTQAFSSKLFCKTSIDNVKPILETRKVRKGRMTYRIPLVTRAERQEGKAISWLIEAANLRKEKLKNNQNPSFFGTPLFSSEEKQPSSTTFFTVPKSENSRRVSLKPVESLSTIVQEKKRYYRSLQYCLAESFLEAFQGKGEGVEKRKSSHQLALQNRAYTHYRWW